MRLSLRNLQSVELTAGSIIASLLLNILNSPAPCGLIFCPSAYWPYTE